MKCDSTTKLCHAPFRRLQQLLTAAALLVRGLWTRLRGGGDRAGDEAMQWVIRLHSCPDLGPLLPGFRQWLSARPENRDQFGELWEFWQELSALKDRNAWRRLSLSQGFTREDAERKPFPWREAIGVTLAIGITLSAGLYLSRNSLFACKPSAANTATQCLIGGHHSSSAGETVSLGLVDGSTVTLSERSEVTLDVRKDRRHVRLDKGEARFQVAKNVNQFEVFLDDDTRIRAVGTDFSVRKMGPQGARVEVREGAVDLLVGDQQAVPVKAGQVAEFDSNVIRLIQANAVWFIFHSEPLTDAVREFNQYNKKPRIIVDGEVSGRSVHGWFLATNPEGFAAMVASTWRMTCFISRDSTGMETIHLSRAGPHRNALRKTRGSFSVEEQQ